MEYHSSSPPALTREIGMMFGWSRAAAVSSRSRRVSFATPASSRCAAGVDGGSRASAPQLVQNSLPSGSGLAQLGQSIAGYDRGPRIAVPAYALSRLPRRLIRVVQDRDLPRPVRPDVLYCAAAT